MKTFLIGLVAITSISTYSQSPSNLSKSLNTLMDFCREVSKGRVVSYLGDYGPTTQECYEAGIRSLQKGQTISKSLQAICQQLYPVEDLIADGNLPYRNDCHKVGEEVL
jgi:hypothetical protein